MRKIISKRIFRVAFTLTLLAGALTTASYAKQVTSYEQVRSETVDEYKGKQIIYEPSQALALDREEQFYHSYKTRLGNLCQAVRIYKSSQCSSGECYYQVNVEESKEFRTMFAELENLCISRKDKINKYWDRRSPSANRRDGRDGKQYVDKVPKPRKAYYPHFNYNGQMQIEVGGRKVWVSQNQLSRPAFDEAAGRWYVLYRGRKAYIAGN